MIDINKLKEMMDTTVFILTEFVTVISQFEGKIIKLMEEDYPVKINNIMFEATEITINKDLVHICDSGNILASISTVSGYITIDFDENSKYYIIEYKDYDKDFNLIYDPKFLNEFFPKISFSVAPTASEFGIVYFGKVDVKFSPDQLENQNIIFKYYGKDLLRVTNELTNFIFDFKSSELSKIGMFEDGYIYLKTHDELYKIINIMGERIQLKLISSIGDKEISITYRDLMYVPDITLITKDYLIIHNSIVFKDGELYEPSNVITKGIDKLLQSNIINRYNEAAYNINSLLTENSSTEMIDNVTFELLNANLQIYDKIYLELMKNPAYKLHKNIAILGEPTQFISTESSTQINNLIETLRSLNKVYKRNIKM
jgi:hypothetical protein